MYTSPVHKTCTARVFIKHVQFACLCSFRVYKTCTSLRVYKTCAALRVYKTCTACL